MAEYNTEQFEKDCKALGVTLSDEQIRQFLKYFEMLVEWNEVMNLTAITEYDEVMKKHFVDSISLCKAYDVTQNKTVIDVGTGAGFPGLALKIAFPNLRVTLLDSLNKRINFLNEVISALGLTGVETIHGRAEDYAKPGKCREKYDLCVSRAVANLSTLSEYCLPFVKVGGKFISYKSEKITEEMNAAQHAVKILGGKMDGQVEFTLPDSDIYRNLFIITKQNSTPFGQRQVFVVRQAAEVGTAAFGMRQRCGLSLMITVPGVGAQQVVAGQQPLERPFAVVEDDVVDIPENGFIGHRAQFG